MFPAKARSSWRGVRGGPSYKKGLPDFLLSTRRLTIRKRFPTINVVLFVSTALTTTAVGALYANDKFDSWIMFFLRGWVFSVPLMAILLVHEMGHYLTGRRHLLDVTPPYFIPAIPPLGTFGAFIKIRSPISNRKVL